MSDLCWELVLNLALASRAEDSFSRIWNIKQFSVVYVVLFGVMTGPNKTVKGTRRPDAVLKVCG